MWHRTSRFMAILPHLRFRSLEGLRRPADTDLRTPILNSVDAFSMHFCVGSGLGGKWSDDFCIE
jgi:hypothetical protein